MHTQMPNALRREETGNTSPAAAMHQREIHKLRQELALERRDLFDAVGGAGAGSTGKRKQPSPQPDDTAARQGGQRTGRVIVAVIVECVPARASTNTDVHPYCIPHPAVDLILWTKVPVACPCSLAGCTSESPPPYTAPQEEGSRYECTVLWARARGGGMSVDRFRKHFPGALVQLYPAKTKTWSTILEKKIIEAGNIMHQATFVDAPLAGIGKPAVQLTESGRSHTTHGVTKRALGMAEEARRLAGVKLATAAAEMEQEQANKVVAAADAEKRAQRKIDAVPGALSAVDILAPHTLEQWAANHTQGAAHATCSGMTGQLSGGQHLAALQAKLAAMLSHLWRQEKSICVIQYGRPGGDTGNCRLRIEFFWAQLVPICRRQFMALVVMAGAHPSLVNGWVRVWGTSLLTLYPEVVQAAQSSERSVGILWQLALRAYIVASGGRTEAERLNTAGDSSQSKRQRKDQSLGLPSWLSLAEGNKPQPSDGTSAGARQQRLINMLLQVVKPFQNDVHGPWEDFVRNYVPLDDRVCEDISTVAGAAQVKGNKEAPGMMLLKHKEAQELSWRLAAASAVKAQRQGTPKLQGFPLTRWPGGTTNRPLKQMPGPVLQATRPGASKSVAGCGVRPPQASTVRVDRRLDLSRPLDAMIWPQVLESAGSFGIRPANNKRQRRDTKTPKRGDRLGGLEHGRHINAISSPRAVEESSLPFGIRKLKRQCLDTESPQRVDRGLEQGLHPNTMSLPQVHERKSAAYYAELVRHGMNILAAVDRRDPGQGPGPVTVVARAAELSGTHIETASPGPGLLSLSAAWEKLLCPDYDDSGLEGPLPDDNEKVQAEHLRTQMRTSDSI
jgi:hypothetical protein